MGRLRRIFTTALAVASACSPPALAASLQWDPNGATPGIGGSGTWNTSSLFWFNGSGLQSWNNASLDDAVFAGTAGTVTLGGAIVVHNLSFSTTGYTVTGGSLTLGGTTPTVDVAAGFTANNSLATGRSWRSDKGRRRHCGTHGSEHLYRRHHDHRRYFVDRQWRHCGQHRRQHRQQRCS